VTTYQLTPTIPNPVTGLSASVLGWHFTGSTFADVYEGMEIVRAIGWLPIVEADPSDTTNTLWRMQLTKNGFPAQVVHDTDWFATDGVFVRVIPQATVTADYTTTAYTLPSA